MTGFYATLAFCAALLATYVEASLNLEAAKIVYEAAREAYLATAKA